MKIAAGHYRINGIEIERNERVPAGYWGAWVIGCGRNAEGFGTLREAKAYIKRKEVMGKLLDAAENLGYDRQWLKDLFKMFPDFAAIHHTPDKPDLNKIEEVLYWTLNWGDLLAEDVAKVRQLYTALGGTRK